MLEENRVKCCQLALKIQEKREDVIVKGKGRKGN